MDYLSMDDDIDLENELMQEQSLYELNYGEEEEEHVADKHHNVLDSEQLQLQLQQLQSNTTVTAYEVSSSMSDKVDSIFESNRSVIYTQDKGSASNDYNNLLKDYTRYYYMHHST